jgi:hypothetical protein
MLDSVLEIAAAFFAFAEGASLGQRDRGLVKGQSLGGVIFLAAYTRGHCRNLL